MREIAQFTNEEMAYHAKRTTAFLRGKLDQEVSPGRWKVELRNGALVHANIPYGFTPSKGISVRLSRVNGLLQVEGPSGYSTP